MSAESLHALLCSYAFTHEEGTGMMDSCCMNSKNWDPLQVGRIDDRFEIPHAIETTHLLDRPVELPYNYIE
jgi:hypothetical protein